MATKVAPRPSNSGKFTSVDILINKAIQLATICSDWGLDEVEIDGKMVDIYDLKQEFEDYFEGR